jgi:sugar phosphate isomerase/epimerase
MLNDIYISSVAFRRMKVEDMISKVRENGWALEFSSGMAYRDDLELLYINSDIKRIPHNYFPIPKVPFVLNLASTDEIIRTKSIEHCKKGLHLARLSNSPFFAAHAGFCIDPDPLDLGKKISVTKKFDKEINKRLFLISINEILKTADKLRLDFLIENNVITEFNYINESNPLLCCESAEIEWLYSIIKHQRFGLLLDTAHLKISCLTLNKNIDQELSLIKPNIKAIHHSDNDGKTDDNLSISNNYWFLEYLKDFVQIPHVLEVKDLKISEIKEQLKILEIYGNR